MKKTRVRYLIVFMLFVLTAINYADRASIAIASPVMAKDLGLDTVQLGFIFSAFGWSYVICQIPGGWLLDRYGSKKVYVAAVLLWSIFTALQGIVGHLDIIGAMSVSTAVTSLFVLRLLIGAAESPSFPGNSRVVAAWFPAQERATAAAIFNSAQYFATVLFAPFMAWITSQFGWEYMFGVMGGLGIIAALVWAKVLYDPKEHPMINEAELKYLEDGGAVTSMDQQAAAPKWGYLGQLCRNRMMVGIYLGQYCINCLTFFFLTWFPVYLVQGRGMTILKAGFVASLPAICGFAGGVLGGVLSDYILRRTNNLTLARKTPIVSGLLLSMSIIGCNFVDTDALVIFFMALAFFGKGIGALGWAVMSDVAPKEVAGLAGGLFNTFGNLSSIITPIAIGYILAATNQNFYWALVFVGVHAFIAVLSYLIIVQDIKRVELKPVD